MRIKQYLLQFSRVLALIVLSIGITLLNPNFLKATNIINVLRQSAPQIIMALGMTIVLLTGGIDLSMGSVTTLASVVTAYLMKNQGLPWTLSVVVGLGVGVVSGWVNGVLIAKVHLPSPVATYGMMWVIRGLAFAIMGASPIFGFSEAFRFMGIGYFLGIPAPVWLMILAVVIITLFLKYTTLGRSIYAVGANPLAARASGLAADRILFNAYMISGALAAFAGIILAARLNAVDQNAGGPFLLPAIAGPVMGGTSMWGGEGGTWGAVLGSLIMVVLTNGMNLLGISSLWQQFVIGLVVVLSVWFDSILRRKMEETV